MTTDDTPHRRGTLARWPGVPRWPLRTEHRVRDTALFAALAAYAWVLAGMAPFTLKSLVAVLIPGAVLGVIAYGKPPERIAAPEELDLAGMSYWLICVAALLEWEASAFADNSRPWHPSLTDLINPLIDPHLIKSVAIMVWLMAGWALVRR